MKCLKLPSCLLLFASLFVPLAVQAEQEWDVTMTVLEEGAEPDDVYEVIRLPPPAAATAREKAATGLERATEARTRAKAISHDAREAARNGVSRGALDNLPEAVRQGLRDEAPSNTPMNTLDTPPSNASPSLPDHPQLPEQRPGG